MKTTASKSQVQAAIDIVNSDYGYKLRIKDDRQLSKNYYQFTITSDSKIPGARMAASGRNLAAASWHAHGYLFDQLLHINPQAVIKTAFAEVYVGDGCRGIVGNWQDVQVGSMFAPAMMSELSIL